MAFSKVPNQARHYRNHPILFQSMGSLKSESEFLRFWKWYSVPIFATFCESISRIIFRTQSLRPRPQVEANKDPHWNSLTWSNESTIPIAPLMQQAETEIRSKQWYQRMKVCIAFQSIRWCIRLSWCLKYYGEGGIVSAWQLGCWIEIRLVL